MSIPAKKTISVIVPTWNESESIEWCLASTWALGPLEIIVSDGGSEDDTVQKVHRFAAARDQVILLSGPRGRGRQLAAGANVARGEILLFLHADCQLHERSLEQLGAADWPMWGGFRQRIDDPRWRFRILEIGNALRVRLMGRVFGDQAIFVRRRLYQRVGGFAGVDLMEDVMLSKQLRWYAWPQLLTGRLIVDPRRWQRRGVIRQTLLNWRIQIAFARGTDPEELRKQYG